MKMVNCDGEFVWGGGAIDMLMNSSPPDHNIISLWILERLGGNCFHFFSSDFNELKL